MTHANDPSHVEAVPGLLREAEKRLDEAFAALSDLTAALPRARLEARLSGVVGQSVLKQATSAGAALVESRGHMVQVHRLLEKLAPHAGVEVAAGDERPKPPEPSYAPFTTGEVTTIGAVA